MITDGMPGLHFLFEVLQLVSELGIVKLVQVVDFPLLKVFNEFITTFLECRVI